MKKNRPSPPPPPQEIVPAPAPKKLAPSLAKRLRTVIEETDREDAASERSRYALLKQKLRELAK